VALHYGWAPIEMGLLTAFMPVCTSTACLFIHLVYVYIIYHWSGVQDIGVKLEVLSVSPPPPVINFDAGVTASRPTVLSEAEIALPIHKTHLWQHP
jgi:hypothetical protein